MVHTNGLIRQYYPKGVTDFRRITIRLRSGHRDRARAKAAAAGIEIVGPKNNLPFFAELLEKCAFSWRDYDTEIVGRMR